MKSLLALIISLNLCLVALASPVIKSSVDKRELELGELVKLKIESSNLNLQNFIFQFENSDYSTVAKSSSSSIEIINGAKTQKQVIELVLKPKHSGDIVIPSVKLNQRGINYNTEEIRISVSEKTSSTISNPKTIQTNKLDESINEHGVFINAELDKNSVYLNEQLLLKLKIYHQGNLRSFRGDDFKFEGFIHKKNDEAREYREFVNSKEFLVYEISYVLFPIKTGRLEIPSNEMEAIVASRKGNYDPWDAFNRFSGLFIYEEPLILKTKTLNLFVKEVPNPPKNFSGYVGELGLAHNLNETEIKEGEAVTLSTKIYGNGNPKTLDLNFIEESKQYKIYKDKEESSSQINNSIEYFQIETSFAIIPNTNRGQLLIKTKPIINFNPRTQKFEEHGLKEFYIAIKANDEKSDLNTPTEIIPENNENSKVILNYSKAQIEAYKSPFINSLQIWVLILFINISIFLFYLIKFLIRSQSSLGLNDNRSKKINELIKEIKKADSLEEISKKFKELLSFYNEPEGLLKEKIEEFIAESDKINYGLKVLEDLEAFRRRALAIFRELKK